MSEKRPWELPFFACRAFEVARLTKEQLDVLQTAEQIKDLGCLYPSVIQSLFRLPPLKTHYRVPEASRRRHDHTAGDHWRQCLSQIVRADLTEGFNPPALILTVENIAQVHEFDRRVFVAVHDGRINFFFDQQPDDADAQPDPDLFMPGHSSRLVHTDRLTAAGEGYPE